MIDNSVTPTPASRIFHPVFSLKGPLFTSIEHPTLPGLDLRSAFGPGGVGNGAACLLPHISPRIHPLPENGKRNPPPAQLHCSPYDPADVDRILFDQTTGEPRPVFDFKEILWIKGGENDCKYWLQVYRHDLKVKVPILQGKNDSGGKRNSIFIFSDDSQRRLLFQARNSGHHITTQFCCTFHDSWPLDGKDLKKMLQAFIKRLKRRFGRDIHYLWCLEFQERGAPHIHFYSDIPLGKENHLFFTESWLAVSNQTGDKECRKFHDHHKNFFTWEMKSGAYLAKEYISKSIQKQVPEQFKNVGRFWGSSRNMVPDFSTIDPRDYEEGVQDAINRSVRIVTKLAQRKFDHHKTFGCLFAKTLALFDKPVAEIPGKVKKQISIGIRLNGSYKTYRLRPPTNFRRKNRSCSLANMAGPFYKVLNWFTAPPCPSGFRSFSIWADDRSNPPPARPDPTPF